MPPKLSIEHVRSSFEAAGYILISSKYIHSYEKLQYICPKGHKHSTSWVTWYTGKRCPMCASNARLSKEFVSNSLSKEGYFFLSDFYINNRTKFKYKCPKGHTNYMTWGTWQMGRRCVTCSNIQMSINVSRERHPNWQGGITCEPYCQDWTKEYKEYIKERDGYRCLNPYCLKKQNKLAVHHIDYNKKNCKVNNLITICTSCNTMANIDREWHTAWYKAILYRRYNYDRPS